MESLSAQFSQAAILMLVGMAVVFTFLGMLVVIVQQLEKLATLFPDQPPAHAGPKLTPQSKQDKGGDLKPELVAAITAAVTRYRQKK